MLRGWPRDVMEMRLEVLGSNTSAKRKKCLSDAISKHLLGLVHEMKRNEYLAARCKYADKVFNAYAIHTNIFIFIFTCVCICICMRINVHLASCSAGVQGSSPAKFSRHMTRLTSHYRAPHF